VGDIDWLERGHGNGEGLQPMIRGTGSRVAAQRVSIRSVLRGSDVPPRKKRSSRVRRRNKVLVGWLLYCCTAVGGTAAAFTVRDTLFPSLGSAPSRSPLWISLTPTVPATDAASTSQAQSSTSQASDTVATTTVTSIDEQLAAGSVPDEASTSSTADDQGTDNGPQTGTTVANPKGPGTTTVTTVTAADDNPGSSSTPTSPTPSSAPAPADDGHQKGKGGGGSTDPSTP